ncbi:MULTISPECIES: NAD(P)-dependent oxidoreductase [Falsihalocynthiibacter]|uniref:NAD(P)-dependent oxidoreductase n=1 Tax=Falsihalocynthiibacter TaxID=2854182 RepID=UPI00300257AD
MKTFPMFLTVAGRRIVICGGGEQAAQKCRLALKTEAQIVIAAGGELDDELAGIIAQGQAELHSTDVTVEVFEGAALVFIATGCKGADGALHAIAKAAGAVVNVVDQPALCDAMTPSIVDRDPVVVAIGTEGTAPVLARQIKTRMEELLEPNLGDLAALVGRLRDSAAHHLGPIQRRDLWRWVFTASPRADFTAGRERPAALAIKNAIANGGAPAQDLPGLCLVSTGQGGRDMMTLRSVKRLQDADVIFYDGAFDRSYLEFARRDAERVEAPRDQPIETTSEQLIKEARANRRVVWLTHENPETCVQCGALKSAFASAELKCETVAGVFSPATE